MDGNVPLLNDSRRHYAEIIHVVHYAALNLNRLWYGPEYNKDYQRYINTSAPFAIANPQSVVDETEQVIHDIIFSIDKVLQLVNKSAHNGNQDSDKAIDEEIKNNGWSPKVFLATGIVAAQLNKDHKDYFAASSQDRSPQSFVITRASKLEKNVMALKNLYGRRSVRANFLGGCISRSKSFKASHNINL